MHKRLIAAGLLRYLRSRGLHKALLYKEFLSSLEYSLLHAFLFLHFNQVI